jgi:hypothetical protein
MSNAHSAFAVFSENLKLCPFNLSYISDIF